MIEFKQQIVESDICYVLELAKEAHEESRFSYISFSSDKVEKIVRKVMKDQSRHSIMLALRNGRPAGFVYCSISEYHIGTGVLLTSIHNINVRKSVRSRLAGGKVALGLFQGVKSWSAARGAHEILFHATSGVDKAQVHSLAKRIGFEFIGGSYVSST